MFITEAIEDTVIPEGKRCALGLAEKAKKEIEALGGVSRIIGNGNDRPDLNKVFEQSLLGFSSGRLKIKTSDDDSIEGQKEGIVLTEKEKELLEKLNRGEKVEILTVVDFDGVIVHPVQTVYRTAKDFLEGKIGWKAIINEIKERGRSGFEPLRRLAEIAQVSQTVIWTSRQEMRGKIRGLFGGGISYFPFMDQDSQRRLRHLGRGNIEVVAGKPMFAPEEQLKEIIEEHAPAIVYGVGSSEKDRDAWKRALKKYPELKEILVVFDTGHAFL